MQACKYCGSEGLVKHGSRNNQQRYLCKDCGHKFYDNGNTYPRMRTPTHIIVASMNLYFEGLSARKVQRQLKEIFGEDISQFTIWSWVQKYSKMVSEYVKTLNPELSGKIHHDETMVKVDGSYKWFWEAIDEDTRFLVASHLSDTRDFKETVAQFRKILEKGRPQVMFLDGSVTYDRAFNKVFYSRYKVNRVEMIKKVGIRARETNNIVERLHGTLKDRVKVMRGLKSTATAKAILEGYVTNYNFCREHLTIDKTPAQASGIEIHGWRQLIEQAQIKKTAKEVEAKKMIEVKVRV